MKILTEILALTVTFLFGFLAAFSGDLIIQAYSVIAFCGLGGLTIALIWSHANE